MHIEEDAPFVTQLINVTSGQALEGCCICRSPEQPGADLHIPKVRHIWRCLLDSAILQTVACTASLCFSNSTADGA